MDGIDGRGAACTLACALLVFSMGCSGGDDGQAPAMLAIGAPPVGDPLTGGDGSDATSGGAVDSPGQAGADGQAPVPPAPTAEPPVVPLAPEPEPEPEPAMLIEAEIGLAALPASTSVGLEWDVVEGATGYRIYIGDGPGFDAASARVVETTEVTHVLRGLQDGSTAHYRVSALLPEGETTPSNEVSATPAGEWVLEELGSGLFDDVLTGADVARVPVEDRVHVLLYAEGYTQTDLPILHDAAGHAGRDNDVDRFVDAIMAVEPYGIFRQAFVVWYLPRPSAEHIGGDTAFAVPVTLDGGFPGTGSITGDGETAARAWAAAKLHPLPPVKTYGGFSQRSLNHIAYFLMLDPERGRASVSGRMTTLSDPESGARLPSAFGIPFAHEFTHAFSQLSDEYLDHERAPSQYWGQTSNVVPTNVCEELPWRHLLVGGAINPDVGELVGAFGREGLGYHPEAVCLLNGTHDNADFYGGSGLLRTDDRMCNFCREMTAFRVFERTAVLTDTQTAFDGWVGQYRAGFYDRFGLSVPAHVPQTNDVRNPEQGESFYEACAPAGM